LSNDQVEKGSLSNSEKRKTSMAKRKNQHNWAALTGSFDFSPEQIKFKGSTLKIGEEFGAAFGTAICDEWFGGGSISADIQFLNPTERSACQIIIAYNPTTKAFLCAGLGSEILYGIFYFDNKWTPYGVSGDKNGLLPKRSYHVEARVRGSLINLYVDGVEVVSTILPVPLPRSQVGVFCRDQSDIIVKNLRVKNEPPRAFVVMQFSSPYNELYLEVVKPVCKEFEIEAVRADETYGPGLIIADVVRQIDEAKFIIAEITPANPNVYYEVGYAHARSKPTILIAERGIEKLPFDLSPFRTLFYENSIDGKSKVEEGLRRHIKAILDPSGVRAV
jgi:hypothetical protein